MTLESRYGLVAASSFLPVTGLLCLMGLLVFPVGAAETPMRVLGDEVNGDVKTGRVSEASGVNEVDRSNGDRDVPAVDCFGRDVGAQGVGNVSEAFCRCK